MSGDLLLEIGTEEIPAWFLAKAIGDLAELARERLTAARLAHGDVKTVGTPRRLALAVAGLADRQTDVSEVVTGPPSKAAFDAAGKPTKAAAGFAQKMGVAVEALSVVEVPGKGAYVAARREEKGGETRALLPRLLGDLVRAVPWKKSMRWASLEEPFVRPVHWICALYGGEVVPLELFGVKSGRESRGHRFLAPGPVALSGSLDDYQKQLRAAYVLVDPSVRRTYIEAELAKINVRKDPELVDEVTNLVEWPVAVVGTFDPEYLQIPREVIISAMRAHQRYFACETGGALENRFVTIAGTVVADKAVVQHGNERVLAARLADARFFWQEDTKVSLDEHARKLAGVVFQAKLGTIADKIARMKGLSWPKQPKFARAAELCKADLVTKMVGEFPDLQGVMGSQHPNDDREVATAILEHYLPRNAGDALPQGDLGAEVGIADRMDTIVGCFAIGLAPTGSADAYGLRRAALAILNILAGRAWRLPLGTLVDDAAAQYAGKISWTPQARAQVLEFFQTRLRGLFPRRGRWSSSSSRRACAASSWSASCRPTASTPPWPPPSRTCPTRRRGPRPSRTCVTGPTSSLSARRSSGSGTSSKEKRRGAIPIRRSWSSRPRRRSGRASATSAPGSKATCASSATTPPSASSPP
jgi:glycyl-tRNA synthetase beta chain